MLHRPFPVSVFIDYSCKDLGKMIAIGVPDEGLQDLGSPVSLDAILDVISTEGEISFCFCYS